ncbi:MAG TPA: hypothetical protein VNE71_06780, partial [Myxococcota bacterium]|nr:hypothetical protein [Myxococcota bacterium]
AIVVPLRDDGDGARARHRAGRGVAFSAWRSAAPTIAGIAIMNENSAAATGTVGNIVMLGDYADRPARTMADGEVLATGRHRLRYLATPHLPHGWDAGLWFDESHRTLFCSDLLFQPGDPDPITEQDLTPLLRTVIAEGMKGPLAHDIPYTHETDAVLQRLAALEPRVLAIMHGSTYRGNGGDAMRSFASVLREAIGPP